MYPILFAALFSRALKNIGRYHGQKGTRLRVCVHQVSFPATIQGANIDLVPT